MKHLDLTPPNPPANLALDEALLDACEENPDAEVLRFWEPADHFVVVGFANRVDREVDVAACKQLKIPIFRRCTGGGTVLQGPGCLNYTLVLRIDSHPQLQNITSTNQFIMEQNRAAIGSLLGPDISVQGFTDLTARNLKFSGNAQRRKRNSLLFHGTFLLNFDLDLVQLVLQPPSKEPVYRQGRSHKQFLQNLDIPSSQIKAALVHHWGATAPFTSNLNYSALLEQKYARDEWNFKF